MALRKSVMVAAAVASIGLGGAVVSANVASATTNGTTIVDKIAHKFSLDKDEVQKVFDEDHAEHKTKHKADIEKRLSKAVSDGKLTEDQKAKILAKMEELKADRPTREEMESKTPEQHKAEMEQKHAELKKWAADNGIPEEYLPLQIKMSVHADPDGPGKPSGGGEIKMLETHVD